MTILVFPFPAKTPAPGTIATALNVLDGGTMAKRTAGRESQTSVEDIILCAKSPDRDSFYQKGNRMWS